MSIVTLNTEDFQSGLGAWVSPGVQAPRGSAWRRTAAETPSDNTGPLGGADPMSRRPTAGNGFVFTEASELADGPWIMDSEAYRAAAGVLTLSFDYHARFGATGGEQDGTLRVQGWNGAAWEDIDDPIEGSQQSSETDGYMSVTRESSGFANDDFRFRIRFERGSGFASGFLQNYDAAVDNIKIIGPEAARQDQPVVDPVQPEGDLGFNSGRRRLHVAKNGSQPKDGTILPADRIFTGIQEALNKAKRGDVVTIKSDRYKVQETLKLTDKTGSGPPIWIVAEERGRVRIANTLSDIEAGEPRWTDTGNGIWRIRGKRPYMGYHPAGKTYLQYYRSRRHLAAERVDNIDLRHGGTRRGHFKKPTYGLAFEPDGGSTREDASGTIFVRLKEGSSPNGQKVKISDGFAKTLMTIDKAGNCIIDGLHFEGSGIRAAVDVKTNSTKVTFRNCLFTLGRFGVRCANRTRIINCEYRYEGFDGFAEDFAHLNRPSGVEAIFDLAKSYFNATITHDNNPERHRHNAFLEGAIDLGRASVTKNVLISRCLIGPCFDGSRIGEMNDSEISDCVFFQCHDDGIQVESDRSQNPSSNITIRDNKFVDCRRDVSHQGSHIDGHHLVYRNLFLHDDPAFHHRSFYSIKMIKTPRDAKVFYYQNTWRYGGTDSAQHWWADFRDATADRILRLFNNIMIAPKGLDGGSGPNPGDIDNNALVLPSSSQTFQGGNGEFAGRREEDMKLGPDFVPRPASPAARLGRSLARAHQSHPALTDSRNGIAEGQRSSGCFQTGETPGRNWPRPMTSGHFDTSLPDSWTSPGP